GRSFRPLGPKGRGCCAQRPLRDASALVVKRAWSRRTGAAYNPRAESPRPRARFTPRGLTKPMRRPTCAVRCEESRDTRIEIATARKQCANAATIPARRRAADHWQSEPILLTHPFTENSKWRNRTVVRQSFSL